MNYNLILRKIFMRTFLTLSIIACSLPFIFAENTHGQTLKETNITYRVKETSIDNVFNQLSKLTGYHFFYDESVLEEIEPVNVQVKNGSIDHILTDITRQTGLQFKKINNTISVSRTQPSPVANVVNQSKKVTGIITDENGVPIIGVNVIEKGTTNGVITDIDGAFSISVSENSTLQISYIGYLSQESAVRNVSQLNIVLKEDMQALEEVVVIGYGTQRARDITTSAANISMKNIKDMPVSGLDQSLTGQVAGVMINSSNGIPGGGPQIQIRGLGAVGAGSQPLYVVDGFPLPVTSGQRENPINDIPPQDIASITVLKDAAATAIYGSRGANGVIMVTTHRGKSGPPRVQLNAYTGIAQVINKEKPDLMNAREFAQFQKERHEDDGTPVPDVYKNPEIYGKGTNWFDEITRVAPTTEVNLSISGGNDKITSYFSAGFMDQQGVVLKTGYRRFSVRGNIDAQLSKQIKIGINVAPTFTFKDRSITAGDGRSTEIGWAMTANPIPSVYNEDGSYRYLVDDGGGDAWKYPNLVQSIKEVDQKTRSQRIIGSIYGEYQMIPGLTFKTTFNTDWTGNNFFSYKPSTIRDLNNPNPSVPYSVYEQRGYLNYASENTLTFDRSFGDHDITALLGYTYQAQNDNSARFVGNDYTDDEIETLNAAARIGEWRTGYEDWKLMSYLARATYGFKDKYLVTAAIRRDGSSRFGQDNRWGFFPSASVGWRIIEEDFMKNISWLSDLKLRASYGIAGNFDIGNYTYYSQVTKYNYVLGGALAGGKRMEEVGNPELGWEKLYEMNAGLEFGLFNDRILLMADFYKRNTKSLLLDIELPASSGYTKAKENNGNLQNKGVELSITTRNIYTKDFSWTTNANIAFNRNKVISLGRGNTSITTGYSGGQNPTHITIVGRPAALFYGFVVEGIYTEDDFNPDGSCKLPAFPGAIPGNLKLKDVDGDGQITEVSDFDIIGSPYPDFTYGMTNTFLYMV